MSLAKRVTAPLVFDRQHGAEMNNSSNALNVSKAGDSISRNSRNNTEFFKVIVQSQRQGVGCLPFRLGLSDSDYDAFKHRYHDLAVAPAEHWNAVPEDDIRQELMEFRREEAKDLGSLLITHRAKLDSSEVWMAAMVAAGCLGADHLWRDLGLDSRDSLSALLELNFPSLTINNTQDMKWKKFFYKQLCEQSGNYLCRAPSCEECATYSACFGPEN